MVSLHSYILALLIAAEGVLSIDLQGALNLAIQRNLTARRSALSIDESRAQARQVLGASLPQITLKGSYARSSLLPELVGGDIYYLPVVDMTTGNATSYGVPMQEFEIGTNREGDIYSAGISLQMPIFAGGRLLYARKGARANLNAAESEAQGTNVEVAARVKKAFYGILLAKEFVRVTEISQRLAREHLEMVRALYAQGIVSNLDLLRAEGEVASLDPVLIRARSALSIAQASLVFLLDYPKGTEIEVDGALQYDHEDISLDRELVEARENRPDLKALRERYTMTGLNRKIARGAFLPSVALFANYDTSKGSYFPPLDKIWIKGYTVGVAASYPIFDGLASVGKFQEARALEEKTGLALGELEGAVRLEVQSAYENIQASKQAMEAEAINLKAAEKNLVAASARYNEGHATNLEVLDAQAALRRARLGYVQAVHDCLSGRAELDRAVGRLPKELSQ